MDLLEALSFINSKKISFILPFLLLFTLQATQLKADDEFKSDVYFKAIYKENVRIGPEEKEKLVRENISITFEFYSEIPRHYYLPLDNFHYTTAINPSGINATLVGSPTPILGVKSNGLMVDGVANAVRIDRSATQIHECFYDMSYCREGFTIGFWINFPYLPTTQTPIMSSGGEEGNHGFSMTIDHEGYLVFVLKLKTGIEWKLSINQQANPIIANKWYHFLVTWSEASGIVFYINGQAVEGNQSKNRINNLPLKEPRQFWIGRGLDPRNYPRAQTTSVLLDEIHFWMDYKTSSQVLELGPITYYVLPISKIKSMLSHYPNVHRPYQGVLISGSPKFISDGKTENALKFNGREDSFVEDIRTYCFHNSSSCFNGFLLSTWLKFSETGRDSVVVDTGEDGFHLSLLNSTLVAEVFVDNKQWRVSWGKVQPNVWYFVELSMEPTDGVILYINQQPTSHSTYKRPRNRHSYRPQHQTEPQIYVAKSHNGDRDFSAVTVDEFKIWYGDRAMLQNIGYILRGRPAMYHFPMDELHHNRMPHQNLTINVHNNLQLVPGKVKNAVELDGEGQYIFIPPNQPNHPPCFGNLNFCKHGATVSMWIKPHDLIDGRHFISTGLHGFNMWQEAGRTKVSARAGDNQWSVSTDKLTPERWQFVEMSYNPSDSTKLKLYLDGLLVGSSEGPERHHGYNIDRQYDGFYFGKGDGTRIHSRYGHMALDEVEYWLANRDYLIKYNFIQRGQLSDYIYIKMDEIKDGKVVHSTLNNIQAVGNPRLGVGRVNNAVNLDGNGQYLDVGKHREICLGNLVYCQDGFNNAMWVKFISMPDYSYLYSNGKGIEVYTLDNQLVFEVDVNGNKWQVKIPGLKLNKWYFVEYTWHHKRGLQVYINNRLVGSTSNYEASPRKGFTQLSSVRIGSANPGEPGRGLNPRTAHATVDEFEFWYSHRDALIASGLITRDVTEYILFPFERQQGTTVVHPDFHINLHNGAKVVPQGLIGNGLSLDGREQYVTFGDQSRICMGNLQACPRGITIAMYYKPKNLQGRGSILSAGPYHIYTDSGRLEAEFSNNTHIWKTSVDRALRTNQWHQLAFSWDPIKGLEVFVDDRRLASDYSPQPHSSYVRDHTVYLGRSTSDNYHGGYGHSDGSIDELQYWYASKDLIDTDPVINKVILDMDVISGTRLVNPYTTINTEGNPVNVPAINATGVRLNGHYQYLHSKGSQLVCHGNLANCPRGFTYRLKLKPHRVMDEQFIFSSAPLDLYLTDQRLNAALKTREHVWKLTSKPLSIDHWYQIDISWSPEEGAIMYVNGEKQDHIDARPNPENSQWSFDPTKDLTIGQSGNEVYRGDHLNAVLDDLQMWHARRDILLYQHLIHSESYAQKNRTYVKFPPAYNSTHYRIFFDSNTWVYYDLSWLPPPFHVPSERDTMSISFKTSDREGMLFFNGDDNNNVHLIIKNGFLYLVAVENGQERIYQISRNPVNDNQWHRLLLDRDGRMLRVTIDGSHEQEVPLDHLINFIQPTHTYVGGINRHRHRVFYINNNFRGELKDIWLRGNRHPATIYLGRLPFVHPFPHYINITGNWRYDKDQQEKLVTPAIIDIVIEVEDKKPKPIVPVTFISERARIDLGEPKPSRDSEDTFELSYKTLAPNGVLAHFKKPQSQGQSDVVIELFEGKPYLVGNFGSGHQRLSFGRGSQATNDNNEHHLKVVNAREYLKLTLDQDTYVHDYMRGYDRKLDFLSPGTRVILGGTQGQDGLPWHVWSSDGYVGCLWNVRINRQESDLWEFVTKQRIAGVEQNCRNFNDGCLRQPCRNTGHCLTSVNNHYCDCAHTFYHGAACEQISRFVSFGGTDKLIYTFNRPMETHTDDISLRFKTHQENAFLFSILNQANNDVIKVDLEQGVGKVETRFRGQNRPTYTTFDCNTPLNDNNWHTLYIKRRANYLEAYVDDCKKSHTYLPEEHFRFAWDKVTLGVDQRNPFVGHLQNFIINRQDYFNFIDHNNNPHLRIYTSIKTSDKENPLILSPITIHRDSNAYIHLPPLQITGNSKVQLMFRTPLQEALLLYNPGINDDFVALEIIQGRLLLRADDGTGLKEAVSSAPGVSDNQWHLVEVQQKNQNELQLIVDGRHRDSLKFQESAHTLDLHNQLYIANVDESLRPKLGHHTRGNKPFAGCIASIVVNRIWYNIDVDRYRSGDQITSGCSELTEKRKYCVPGICMYGGHCHEVTNGFRCDCSTTANVGTRCEEDSKGLRFGERNERGIAIFQMAPVTTDHDIIAFGFMTYSDRGTLLRIDSSDTKDFTEFKLVDGRLVTTYRVGGANGMTRQMSNLTQRFNDGMYHRVLYERRGANATVRVDDIAQDQSFPAGDHRRTTFNNMHLVKMGGNLNAQNRIIDYYNGILAGVSINGIRSIDLPHQIRHDVMIASQPFHIEKVSIKVSVKPIDITRPTLPPGVVTAVTPFASTKAVTSGGGAEWGDGKVIGGEDPRYEKIMSAGVARSIGSPGASAAAAVGTGLALLLLASSLMWALFRFKPGLFPGWDKALSKPLLAKSVDDTGAMVPSLEGYEISGDNRVLPLTQDHVQGGGQSVTYTYERSQTFAQPDAGMMGVLTFPNFSMRNMDLSYGGFNQQDIFTQQQQQRMLQQQQQLMSTSANSTMARNYMAAEEIRVDCVQMTNNGRFVVTGSNCGPPQVWDLKSGELVRVMRGDQFSSTDLHLANGDTLLVGQVAELESIDSGDVSASNRIHQRRIQLWDFETGKAHDTHKIEMCTASCMMNDGERLVLGRTEKLGDRTTVIVYDLLAKEAVRSFQSDSSTGFGDPISYLNVSKDNRYIIAGFQKSYDNTANYVVFDQASNDPSGIRVPSMDASVEVTAVLNDVEAVTGTRKGELIVWSLRTGQVLRLLGGGGMLHDSNNDHHGDIKDLTVSKDGQFLVSASADGSLKVWDLDQETPLHTLIGHKDEVWCCCLSPDNELVGSGSKDGTIRMWKVSDGSPVAAIDAGMTIFKVLLSNNKKTVVALGDKGGARKLIMLKVVRSTATIDRRKV